MVGFALPKDEAERLQGGAEAGLVIERGHCELKFNHTLGGEIGSRGRADVFDLQQRLLPCG